jgi:hypothetical protein
MQRGRMKWATLRDEHTKFFHNTATIKHNKNSIMVLKDGNGTAKFNNEDKSTVTVESFQRKIGHL